MKLIQLIPGAGNNFYCENCLRDHGLAKALCDLGHDAMLVPLYLPIMTDSDNTDTAMPVFFGGINVYMQQKLNFFRRSPQWIDKLLDHPRLLRWAAGMQGMTRAKDLAETTISMLKGQDGHQVKELNKLIEWLKTENDVDAIYISNALLLGLARPIKEALNIPVFCALQDEDIFIDPLPENYRQQVWDLMAQQVQYVDGFITVSDYYAEFMSNKISIPSEKLHRIYNGIDISQHSIRQSLPNPPVIGYLERQCPDKGLHTLVEAFIKLKSSDIIKDIQLHIAGGQTAEDAVYVRKLKRRIRKAGFEKDVLFLPNLSQAAKVEFLSNLTLLSVPARHAEAFGIYILDALAAGVPVVLPDHGAFPEILKKTGGGQLYAPHDVATLAETLELMLGDTKDAKSMGLKGRTAVEKHFTIEKMAHQYAKVFEQIIS
ncbi:glycosyltransferase family 4 protein [bacterium]|nr:glycosyltransferase family 4 protein [bacterium]